MQHKRLSLVSIVIPVYNEAEYLDACLQAISRQTVQPYEVIVVDNNSTDNSVAIARSYPFVTILRERRQGVVYARDCGFNAARGGVIGRIDADTIIAPDWVASAAGALAENGIGAITGRVVYGEAAFAGLFSWFDLRARQLLSRAMRGKMYLYGSNMAIRRNVWHAVRKELCSDKALHEDMDLAAHIALLQLPHVAFDKNLKVTVPFRRVAMPFSAFCRYVFMMPRSMTSHGIAAARYLYIIMAVVILSHWFLRFSYLGYDKQTGTFSLKRALAKPASYRLSPITLDD